MDTFTEDQYEVFVWNSVETLLRLNLRSRQSNNVRHTVFIHFTLQGKNRGWYYICKVGARVVGCCANVASILWYLGYFRFLGTELHLLKFHGSMTDASPFRETDSESESDILCQK